MERSSEKPAGGAATTVHVGDSLAFVREPRFRLTVERDGGSDSFVCETGRAIIGSHKAADLVVQDRTVSRFHCEIEVQQQRAFIRDLDSRNGTLVDGVHILRAYLKDGAILSLGRSRVRFELRPDQELPISERTSFGALIGTSQQMRRVFALLEKAAESNAAVLLQGEPGTGKASAAETIHSESARSGAPFIAIGR